MFTYFVLHLMLIIMELFLLLIIFVCLVLSGLFLVQFDLALAIRIKIMDIAGRNHPKNRILLARRIIIIIIFIIIIIIVFIWIIIIVFWLHFISGVIFKIEMNENRILFHYFSLIYIKMKLFFDPTIADPTNIRLLREKIKLIIIIIDYI